MQDRLDELLDKNAEDDGLSEAENKEINRILMLNRVVTLAKIKARKLLS